MNDIAIRVENLSKLYHIGKAQQRHDTMRDALAERLRSSTRWLRRSSTANRQSPTSDEDLWALKDVSFEVKRGEVLGIIGRNGAGKSTLLKILSRITEPTAGRVVGHGRVGSLLEVGTGFHPELTGRENIYLNGAMLGMKRIEIERKFDEMVAFSEIEKFLDTPVKRYSSGMYVRLAFAVAAHLEPDILLVDEVLAVGDIAFQQKCLRYISELWKQGMTIFLVSHSMVAIQSICKRVMLLEHGKVESDGEALDVIEKHRQSLQTDQAQDYSSMYGDNQTSKSAVLITGVEMFGEDGVSRRDFRFGEPVRIRIDLDAMKRIERPLINFGIKRGDGVVITGFNNWYDNFDIDFIEGECSLEGCLPPLRLIPDFYEIHILVWPSGGGHVQDDMTQLSPLAAVTFGHFRIYGIGLNAHDGVFQTPAIKWTFRRGDYQIESGEIKENSIAQVFRNG